MTTLMTALTNRPLEGLAPLNEVGRHADRTQPKDSSFRDALSKAGVSEKRPAERDRGDFNSGETLSERINAERGDHRDQDVTTTAPDDSNRAEASRDDGSDATIGAHEASTNTNTDSAASEETTDPSAQQSSDEAQGLPNGGTGEPGAVQTDGNAIANAQINLHASEQGQSSRAVNHATSHANATRQTGQLGLHAQPVTEGVPREIVPAGTRSGQVAPSQTQTLTDAQAINTVRPRGETESSSNVVQTSENGQANGVAANQLHQGPGQAGSSDGATMQALAQRTEASTNQQSEGGTSNEGERDNARQAHFATSGGTAAENRAAQLDSALRLEQATGQGTMTDQGVRTTSAASINGTSTNSLTDLTSSLNAAKSESTDATTDARFTNRVVRGLSAMINQRGGVMSMRLDPPELGQLRIQMSLSQGVVKADFEASNPQAHDLINKNLSNLRAALESQGLTVERLHVQTASTASGQGATDGSADDQATDHHDGEQDARRDQDDANSDHARDDASPFEREIRTKADAMSAPVKGARTA